MPFATNDTQIVTQCLYFMLMTLMCLEPFLSQVQSLAIKIKCILNANNAMNNFRISLI